MATSERIDEVKEAIATHLKVVGPYDWEEVRKDFPDISGSSFWRYVKSVKQNLEHQAAPQNNSDLFTEKKTGGAREHDPLDKRFLNSPFRALKHGERISELYADALAVRDHALYGEGRIKNPTLFAKSIRIREQLLYAEMNVVESIDAAGNNKAIWEKITDVIANASPEVAKEIMERLHELNTEVNFSDTKT